MDDKHLALSLKQFAGLHDPHSCESFAKSTRPITELLQLHHRRLLGIELFFHIGSEGLPYGATHDLLVAQPEADQGKRCGLVLSCKNAPAKAAGMVYARWLRAGEKQA